MLTTHAHRCLCALGRPNPRRRSFYITKCSLSSKKLTYFCELLEPPSWSVRSLLPPADSTAMPEITSKQLHHLLRLSALPLPNLADDQTKLLETLESQLHFVRKIQQVDTTNVEPLRAIRDESREGQEEQTIGVFSLQKALEKEEVVGKHYKRIQRRASDTAAKDAAEDWDPLTHAKRKAGKYFTVQHEKA